MKLVRGIALALALIGAACKAYDPTPDEGSLATCCGGFGSCVPGGLVPSSMREMLAADSCGESQLCAPVSFLSDPYGVPASCRAPGDLEGRCLPTCLPQIGERAGDLQRRSCRDGELCAPCYDPRTGKDTGACRIQGDPGPAERPRRFDACCSDHGECVPREILGQSLTDEDLARLDRGDCARDALCTPDVWLSNPDYVPATCRIAGDREGRCLSSCLPDVARQADALQRRSCEEGDLCVPCYDPTSGKDTGACRAGDDRPADPPRTFASCCGGRARCIPKDVLESVDPADLAHLDGAECSESDALCVPNAWLEDSRAKPQGCRAPGDLEGRCLLGCLPDVAARGDGLMQQDCDDSELCVPCFDPRTGEESGACRIAGDEPHESARTFERCCGERSRCVPQVLAERTSMAGSLERLSSGECSQSDMLCIPDSWLDGEPPPPAACRAPGDFEGRCLLTCLPDVAARAAELARGSCDEDERCVPCFDPRTGEASGACATGTDQPSEPARSFVDCCAGRGSCVPRETLSQSDDSPLDMLGPDTCPESDNLCVMKRWLDGERPSSCRVPGDLEGRCLPSCLPAIAAQRDGLRQSTCDASERCVPCFDPLTGADTGACRIAADQPAEPTRVFEACCSKAGRCVPPELLTSDQSEQLPAGGCTVRAERCAPAPLLTSDSARFPTCRSQGQPGLCLADCFLPSDAVRYLSREGCGASERCVSCARLPAGLGAACP